MALAGRGHHLVESRGLLRRRGERGEMRGEIRFKVVDLLGRHIHIPGGWRTDIQPGHRTDHFPAVVTNRKPVMQDREIGAHGPNREREHQPANEPAQSNPDSREPA